MLFKKKRGYRALPGQSEPASAPVPQQPATPFPAEQRVPASSKTSAVIIGAAVGGAVVVIGLLAALVALLLLTRDSATGVDATQDPSLAVSQNPPVSIAAPSPGQNPHLAQQPLQTPPDAQDNVQPQPAQSPAPTQQYAPKRLYHTTRPAMYYEQPDRNSRRSSIPADRPKAPQMLLYVGADFIQGEWWHAVLYTHVWHYIPDNELPPLRAFSAQERARWAEALRKILRDHNLAQQGPAPSPPQGGNSFSSRVNLSNRPSPGMGKSPAGTRGDGRGGHGPNKKGPYNPR